MKKIKFVLGIHNHQPIGNFDFVFEEAYQKSYRPFLEILERHPGIRISIHFTGILLDWLEQNHPDLLHKVRTLVGRGQLEVMSGGYYEPILSVIPERDRIGQIKKLSERVQTLFNYEPQGMWLAERVWEPGLPGSLNKAGMKYTVVDDTHFKYTGLQDKDLDGYFITEDNGLPVKIFPINKMLRYTIPFQDARATIDVLRDFASDDGQKVVVFADDGEKFGVWPDTYRHVYENGWLENFFSALEQESSWVEMVHFAEVINQVQAKDRIYLPTASYAEMMHWALFTESFRNYEDFEHLLADQGKLEQYGLFVRGGFWRNFMTKYPEVNLMHKKMLRVSNKIASSSEPDIRKSEALDHLWAGQCNCPYWHGVFGGLYLSHLRHAIYSNLIEAEKALEKLSPTQNPNIEIYDYDLDGQDEILIDTGLQNVYISPSRGGILLEHDFKPVSKNILDTMTRRPEGYHNKLALAQTPGQNNGQSNSAASIHDLVLAKEAGLEKYLNYDSYLRRSLIDHFFDDRTTVNEFEQSRYAEQGNFINAAYQCLSAEVQNDQALIVLSHLGRIGLNDLFLQKKIGISGTSALCNFDYLLVNKGSAEIQTRFGIEFNFGLQAGHAHDRYYTDGKNRLEESWLDSTGSLPEKSEIGLRDEYMNLDIRLSCTRPAEIWRVPVQTISLSEAGFERVYQSSCVIFLWNLVLAPGDSWELRLSQTLDTVV